MAPRWGQAWEGWARRRDLLQCLGCWAVACAQTRWPRWAERAGWGDSGTGGWAVLGTVLLGWAPGGRLPFRTQKSMCW